MNIWNSYQLIQLKALSSDESYFLEAVWAQNLTDLDN